MVLLLIIILVLLRYVEAYFFIKNIVKICKKYDWKIIDENPELLLVKMSDKHYYVKHSWSALNFLWLNGPSMFRLVFSLKRMTIKNHYRYNIIEKLEKYEII